MEQKRKNTGTPLIIIGSIIFLVHISKMNFDNIRKSDIVFVICQLIVVACGIYANVKNKKVSSNG